MSSKTPAEQQIEFLKKLKQGGGGKQKLGGEKPQAETSGDAPKKSRRAKPATRSLKLSEESWRHLEAILKASQEPPKGLELGDWIVELLSRLPMGLSKATQEQKEDFFALALKWCQTQRIEP